MDQSDWEWFAYLLRNGLIEGCYVPEHEIRLFLRKLTRLKTKIVQILAVSKNRYTRCCRGATSGLAPRFGKTVVRWAGLCPLFYQTAEKNLTGRIKQRSKNLRRMMIQVAHATSRTRDSRLRLFYLRVATMRGKKKAIVALTHKILAKSITSSSTERSQN